MSNTNLKIDFHMIIFKNSRYYFLLWPNGAAGLGSSQASKPGNGGGAADGAIGFCVTDG
jgi:hypothetical protein